MGGTFTGEIKSFAEKTGYGFISCPGLKQKGYANDVIVMADQILPGFEIGSKVSFSAHINRHGKLQATDLKLPGTGIMNFHGELPGDYSGTIKSTVRRMATDSLIV